MAWYNTLNVPKLINENGKIKFLPVIYAQQYEIEYRYVDASGKIQNNGSITIDYDSRANGIGDDTIFLYRDKEYPELTFDSFLQSYNETFSVINNNSKYYTAGFIILNFNRESGIKPIDLKYYNNIEKIGIQEVVNYFETDSHITEVNMKFNTANINSIFSNLENEPPVTSLAYIRYCFNAVDLSTYMENILYNSIRIRAVNGRFPYWYSTQNDSPWSNWFYIDYKPNEILLETYVNKAKYNTLYKYNLLDFKNIITGIFRENVSVDKPIIEIELDKYPDFNYIYIREFDRFYFVSNVVCSNKNLYILYCSVDVLMSFRHDIDKQLVLLKRSSSKGSDFLIDELALVEKSYDIIEYDCESTDVFSFNNGSKYLTDEYKYIDKIDTVLIFSTSTPTTTDYYTKISCNNLPSYSPFSSTSNIVFCDKKDVNTIINTIFTFDKKDWDTAFEGSIQNSTDLISSIKIYPFSFLDNPDVKFLNSDLAKIPYVPNDFNNVSPYLSVLRIGNKDIEIKGEYLYTLRVNEVIGNLEPSDYICRVNIGKIKPKDIIVNFLDKEPYSIYEIYIPFIGFQKIDSKYLEYEEIDIDFNIDLSNGETMCILSTHDYGYKILQVFNTNISIDIPITKIDEMSRISAVRRNEIENENLKERSAIKASRELVSGISKSASSFASGKIIGGISNIIEGVTSSAFTGLECASEIDKNNKLTQLTADTLKASTGQISPSKYLSFSLGTRIYIKKMKQKINNTYENLIEHIGKPSNYYGSISSLSGYEEISLVYLKNISNITLVELEELQEILKKGIFIGNRNF